MTENLEQTIDSPTAGRPPKKPRTESCGVGEEEEQQQQKEPAGSLTQPMSQNPRIQRYLIAIEYIGTRFSGSQQQPACRTVVGVLEDAFLKFVGKPVSVLCSSRTDAGVHAVSNVCHVDVERISKRKPGEVLPPHEPSVVRRAINHFLHKNEGDILVTDVRCVPADFHARYKALERTYFYRILSGSEPLSAFDKDRAWHVQQELNVCAMKEACKILAGHHDFTSFRATGCQAKSPIRTVDELSVTEVLPSPYFPTAAERRQYSLENGDCDEFSRTSDTEPTADSTVSNGSAADFGFGSKKKHRCFIVTARARSFLYHQVRLLVGVLKSAGTGDLTSDEVKRILDAKDVTQASAMAPACGLYLGQVKYDLSGL